MSTLIVMVALLLTAGLVGCSGDGPSGPSKQKTMFEAFQEATKK